MKVTPKQIKAQREIMVDKLRKYVPETFPKRIMNGIYGFGFFALFPILSVNYPSCMFMAYMGLAILVCLQVATVSIMSFSIEFMKQMPVDVRKMQYTMLGDANHRIVNLIFGSIMCWTLFNCGFPALAVTIALLSILIFIINTQYRIVCKSEVKW